ncbi:MAG TPA: HAMP domain-containing sensor histidine kinase [Candidatus Eremiobacteraceae bacterium]|nr:HAMP domain-containing sensor histidine kinase [Candidatus Eremiobacteraceae bacterium]
MAWYGGLLLVLLVAFSVVVDAGANRYMMSSTADRINGVTQQIEAVTRGERNEPFGVVSVRTLLSDESTLNTFAGAGLFVEVFTPGKQLFPIGRSGNLSGFDLPTSGYIPWRAPGGFGDGWGTARTDVGPVLAHWITINGPQGPEVVVYVAESLTLVQQTIAAFGVFLLISMLIAAIAVIVTGTWLARTAVAPINEIATAAREIGGEDLAKRLNWQERRDELGVLASTFDEMLGRLEAAFARERRFIADASHELKTPLTVINGNAQMLQRWADRDPALRAEAMETIRSESASMARVINAMLTLAKTDDAEALSLEPVSLSAVLHDASAALRPSAERKGLALEVRSDADATVRGEPGLLRQLITNLTENAIKFTQSGRVTLTLERVGPMARITVSDTGPGIPEEALPHVFERFYRADPARSRKVEGTGLGLAVVRNIVRVHGGEIRAENPQTGGAAFVIELPVLQNGA